VEACAALSSVKRQDGRRLQRHESHEERLGARCTRRRTSYTCRRTDRGRSPGPSPTRPSGSIQAPVRVSPKWRGGCARGASQTCWLLVLGGATGVWYGLEPGGYRFLPCRLTRLRCSLSMLSFDARFECRRSNVRSEELAKTVKAATGASFGAPLCGSKSNPHPSSRGSRPVLLPRRPLPVSVHAPG
jgi:hypothetical protein